MKYFFCIIHSLLFACVSPAFSQESAPLRVGMELTYPPFEMIDHKGDPIGISVEIAQALGRFLEKKIEIENCPFIGLIPALHSGKIDLILSSMSATPEREKSISFSDPYLKTGLCLLVAKDSSVQSIEDLNQADKVVAVKLGTTGNIYADLHLKNAKLLVFDKESCCVLEVVQGKADAFIYDQFSVFKHWQNNPETTRAVLRPFSVEHWAVGLRTDNEILKQQVNAFLQHFRKNNGFEEIGNRYFKEQKEVFEKLNIPFCF